MLVRRLSLAHQHPAKLDCSSRGAAIASLSQLLQPPWLDHKSFLSVAATMALQETDPLTHHRGPSQAGGHCAGVEASPGLLTLGPDPGPAPLPWGQAQSSEDRSLLQRTGDEQLFTGAERGAASGSALTTGDRAGQPGQGPAAGHRSESESSRAH